MIPLPSTSDLLDVVNHTVLPAAGGAAFVMCAVLVLGRWAATIGSALAVSFGFIGANFTFTALDWEKTGRVFTWKLEEPIRAWHTLPRAALLLLVVGLISRGIGRAAQRYLTRLPDPEHSSVRAGREVWGAKLLTWAPRVVALGVISGWLIPPEVIAEGLWVRPLLALGMLGSWLILDRIARAGASGQVTAYLAAIFVAAAIVMLYAHSARFMEIGLMMSCALLGVAVAAGSAKVDASGAVPAGIAFLPGLMLNGRVLTESQVPAVCFWLVGLAPLALAPFAIPVLVCKNGRLVRALRVLLVFIPITLAVILAAGHEQLVFE